jgi:hypothetical protein
MLSGYVQEKLLAGSYSGMGGALVSFLPFLRAGSFFFFPTSSTLTTVSAFFEGPFRGVCAKRMCECVCEWEGLLCGYACFRDVEGGSIPRLVQGDTPMVCISHMCVCVCCDAIDLSTLGHVWESRSTMGAVKSLAL